MITSVAHELAGAVTDPQPFSGWATSLGHEVTDLCAWDFIETRNSRFLQRAYNMHGLFGYKYLVQSVWDRDIERCVITL